MRKSCGLQAWILPACLPLRPTNPCPALRSGHPCGLQPRPLCPQGNQVTELSRSISESQADTNLNSRTKPTCRPRKLNPIMLRSPRGPGSLVTEKKGRFHGPSPACGPTGPCEAPCLSLQAPRDCQPLIHPGGSGAGGGRTPSSGP